MGVRQHPVESTVIMRASMWRAAAFVLLAAGCGDRQQSTADGEERRWSENAPAASAPQSDVSPPEPEPIHEGLLPLPEAADSTWQEFQGAGFAFRYPPGAHLQRRGDTLVVSGPHVRAANPNPDVGVVTGPSYMFRLAWAPNRGERSTSAWVDSLRADANAGLAEDPDSLGFLAPPDTVWLADNTLALSLEPFCGDCSVTEVYVASPSTRVVMYYGWDISVPGHQRAQYRLYDAMRRTFRWVR